MNTTSRCLVAALASALMACGSTADSSSDDSTDSEEPAPPLPAASTDVGISNGFTRVSQVLCPALGTHLVCESVHNTCSCIY